MRRSFSFLQSGLRRQICIDTASKEEADRIFQALSKDGKVTMPMQETFWNAYFGTLTDQFGIQWMVSYANE